MGEAHGTDAVAYGTFVEYTNLVGALGFHRTVEALAVKKLVCIDEFELDDAGDTTLMSRLMRELADRDVALAATSNTLPDALGEGASRPRTSSARSRRCPTGSRPCGSTARTTATATSSPTPSR
nr:hypothetical protein GCM10025730_52860 [Promicromonospora thailandica]